MRKIPLTLFLLLLAWCGHAQKDSLIQLYKPYQTAMGMLGNLKRSVPQDSAVISEEWCRLNTVYKQLSDSLLQHNNQIGIHFEARRLIDVINYRQNNAQLDQQLKALYQYVASHQNSLLKDDAQFTRIAQCLMGVKPEGETNESNIIAYNADVINDFYKELDTSTWSEDQHQRFITTFATAYLKIGSVRKAEKLYRHFDTLFVKPTTTKTIKNFSLPDSTSFYNPYLMKTTKNWASLQKGKIVIRPKGENLFDFVYLVSLMRTIHREYAEEYDIVLVHHSDEELNAYLNAVKQNLAFSDYYLATYKQDTLAGENKLPAVMMVSAEGDVTQQAKHINTLFKELNAPLEAKKEQKITTYWSAMEQKKDSLAKRAVQTQDSISYRSTHENITFILKGLWGEDLYTHLTPIGIEDTDKETNSTADQDQGDSEPGRNKVIERSRNEPFLAEFKVEHPQYTVYQLPVLVTGKEQEITISSGFPNTKEVNYAKKENAAFYEALQNIDKSQAQVANYEYTLKNYPFQNTPFVSYLQEALQQAKALEQQAINSVYNAKAVLENYANAKRRQQF
jgi:hypothetical protein